MNTSDALRNMAFPKNLHREAVSKSSNPTTLIAEQPEGRQLKGGKIDSVNPSEFPGIILPVSLVITAVTLLIIRFLCKREQSINNDFLTYLNQVPCMNCHFFCMNQHLKCAVNPSWVLTKKAINCLDYRPSSYKFPLK